MPLRLAASACALELVLPDGLAVRLPPGFDEDSLRRLLALLRGTPC